jgi:hypothetical protein
MKTDTPNNPDFPERWSPMTVRELRQALRQPFFIWPFIFIHLLAILAILIEWQSLQQSRAGGLDAYAFWAVAYSVIALLMPFRNFDALLNDLDAGNNELLVLAGLTRWKIVGGKCRVQLLLSLLTLCSLLPYMVVRYFFGGFELFTNLLLTVEHVALTFSITGVVVGASGYKSLGKKVAFILLGTVYSAIPATGAIATIISISSEASLPLSAKLAISYGLFCAVLIQIFLGVLGLQIGRGHLKVFLRPWESPPTSAMMALFIMCPAILFLGGLVTLGVGFILPIGLLLWIAIRYDRVVPHNPNAHIAPYYRTPAPQPPELPRT